MRKVDNPLQVWHFPQVPCTPFKIPVKDEIEANKIIEVLAYQHLWLFEKNMIPDFTNVLLVVMQENGEWVDYWNNKELMDWDDFHQKYLNHRESEILKVNETILKAG